VFNEEVGVEKIWLIWRVIESVEVWYARAKHDSAKPKLRLFGLP